MFQQFLLILASLVMTQKNIRLEWFGRGNIDDIETGSEEYKNVEDRKSEYIKIIPV